MRLRDDGIPFMMTKDLRKSPRAPWIAAAALILLPLAPICAQNSPASSASPSPANDQQTQPNVAPAQAAPNETAKADSSANAVSIEPDSAVAGAPSRAQAYYHLALASVYEDDAVSDGHTDEINQAIEQYKLALNADPDSAELSDDLADLYFRADGVHDAETAGRTTLKAPPDDIDAHRLLGRIYLRQLGEGQNGGTPAANSATVLDQ